MGMKGKRSQDKWINTLIRYVFRAGKLTWHEGYIPPSEVWLKIGGDKGGGTFKMNFQIVNVATPNSVYTTKVFLCGDYEFLSKMMYGISGASGM